MKKNKELKHFSRKELLEMLIQQQKENDYLHTMLEAEQDKLRRREISIREAGSIAEASLKLSGMFEAADEAVELYVENIKSSCERQQIEYDETIAKAEEIASGIISDAENEKQRKMKEADEYWQQLSTKLEEFYKSHQEIKALMAAQPISRTE